MTERARAPERVRMTRGARWLLVVAMASAAMLGFGLVRTFRGPALEAAATPAKEQVADTGRDPVPPEATMPGAPDAGWARADNASDTPAPAAGVMPLGQSTALPPPPVASTDGVRSYVPSAPRPLEPRRRAYTDADLRAYVATRGVAATRDQGYVLALRQRRVDDLRERLANARTAEDRAALRSWLDDALRDLERVRQ